MASEAQHLDIATDRLADDIAAFVASVTHYFAVSSPQPAAIGSPYLVATGGKFSKDFTGIIEVSGRRSGCVYFTAPRGMLRVLLMQSGETEISDTLLRDLIGEMTNTISGNVRREFGRDFAISVPRVIAGEPDPAVRPERERAIVIPINWRNYEAQLVVALN